MTWAEFAHTGVEYHPMSINWDLADTRYGGSTVRGTRTVYAQFRDRTGKWSPTMTDTIEYVERHAAARRRATRPTAQAVTASGPRAYWRLGETSGNVAADQIGQHAGGYSAGGHAWRARRCSNSDVDRAVQLNGVGRRSTSRATPT